MIRFGFLKSPRWTGARGIAVGGISLLLVVALGVATLLTSASASREASAVHGGDRVQSQKVIAGLTQQYLKFSALELSRTAGAGHWSLRRGSSADRDRLRALIASSPLFGYGAAIVDLMGEPLSSAARSSGLPPATDPGYVPMAAALRAGSFGLSDVMRVAGARVVATAVPISVAGTPRALLVGFSDARRWSLQAYSAEHARSEPSAIPYIVDGSGTIAATSASASVGAPVTGSLRRVGTARSGLLKYSDGGKDLVATYSPVGIGNWRAMTVQPASEFSGALDSHANAMGIALIALLTAAIGGLILLTLKRNQALRRLADDALCDQVTGLYSRRLFSIRLESALSKQRRTRAHVGVLYGDLDAFKEINDRFGHTTGDAALQEVARRLRGAVRPEDAAARYGGDEFVVLLEDVEPGEVSALASSLEHAVGGEALLRGARIDLRVSFGGVVIGPEARTSAAEIMHAADLAMYRAKSAGKVDVAILGETAWEPGPRDPMMQVANARTTLD
ncbi:MAG: hypothetical protein NVSMB25_14700 [Thermoleophilaceae bacterium]